MWEHETVTGFVNLLSKYSHSPPPVNDIRGSAHSFLSDDAGVERLGGGMAFPIKLLITVVQSFA